MTHEPHRRISPTISLTGIATRPGFLASRSTLAASEAAERGTHREVGIGALIAVGLIVATALGIDWLVVAVALVASAAAVISPAVGLAVIAGTVSLHEPDVFRPLSLPVVLVGALALGVLARTAVDRTRGGLNLMLLLAVGYLALAGVSVVPQVTGLGYEPTVSAVYEWLQIASILVTIALAAVVMRGRDARPYLWLAMASVVFTTLLALFLMQFSSFEVAPFRGLFSTGEFTRRAVGTFNDPNYYGMYLAIAAAIALALARETHGPGRWAGVAIAGLCVAVVVLTFSRGAFGSLAAGLVLSAFAVNLRVGIVASLALAIAATAAAPAFLAARISITSGGIYAQPLRDLAESDSYRTDAFEAGLRLFAESPVFGTGFGQFPIQAKRYAGDNPTTNPHNAAIKMLAEQGIVGVMTFAGLLLAGGYRLVRASSRLILWPAIAAYAAGALFLEPLTSFQTSGVLALAIGTVLAGAWPRRTSSVDAIRPVQIGLGSRSAPAAI